MNQTLLVHHGNIINFPLGNRRFNRDSTSSVTTYPTYRCTKKQSCNYQKKDDTEGCATEIKKIFENVDLSVSPYDTAWVAMVPWTNNISTNEKQVPCFPNCLEWIMENQKADGSWGLNHTHPSLVKDTISSTLACIIALKKWKLGEQLVHKGMDFIASNKYGIMDRHQTSPLGFDIIFPKLITYATDLGLNLPMDTPFIDLLLHNRDLQLQSLNGKESRLGYFAEGLEESYDWEHMIKHEQKSNGSIFNSPASTAATFINLQDDACFNYLNSLVDTHGGAVPTVSSFDIRNRICAVDTIERLGVSRLFQNEIKTVLDETYRRWQQRDDEIFSDVVCRSMAFRLLRLNRYRVSSDVLGEFIEQEHYFKAVSLQFTNTETIIELYRASQLPIYQNEPILDKIKAWTSTFLKHQLLNNLIVDERLRREVEYAFDYPFLYLDRLRHRRGIELYHTDKFRMLKTSYTSSTIDNKDVLMFAQEDFNKCQIVQRDEMHQLETWAKNNRIATLEFDWHILVSSYIIFSGCLFAPEFRDSRIAWTQSSFVGTIIDDMFDIDGSKEELLNLLDLVERWDGHSTTVPGVAYFSKRVEILFLALQEIINYQASTLFSKNGRYSKHEFLGMWRKFLLNLFREWDWWKNRSTPTLDEFVTNGVSTIGVGLFSINFHFLGVELSNYLFKSEEYRILESHLGGSARLYNDYQSLERDLIQRKLNACYLIVSNSDGTKTLEDATAEVRKMIEFRNREALRMLLQPDPDSVIPKQVVESFFSINKFCYYLYHETDEFRAPGKTLADIRALLYAPINLL